MSRATASPDARWYRSSPTGWGLPSRGSAHNTLVQVVSDRPATLVELAYLHRGKSPCLASFDCAHSKLKWPLPIRGVGPVDAELVGVLCARDLLVEQCFANAGTCDTETGYPVNSIHGQGEAVGLIADGELQRRVDVALLLVAAHVNVVLTGPAVRESMDEPRVGVKVEDHGLVRGEKSLELTVCQTVGVFGIRHQFSQVNDVHEADLHVG